MVALIFGIILFVVCFIASAMLDHNEKEKAGIRLMLVIGMAVCIMLFLIANNELTEKTGYNTKIYSVNKEIKVQSINGQEIKRDTIYYFKSKL